MRQECHLDARGCVGSTSRHFLLYDWATIALRFLVIVRAAIAAEILRRGEILRGIGRAVPLELREGQIAGGGHAASPSERRRARMSRKPWLFSGMRPSFTNCPRLSIP